MSVKIGPRDTLLQDTVEWVQCKEDKACLCVREIRAKCTEPCEGYKKLGEKAKDREKGKA